MLYLAKPIFLTSQQIADEQNVSIRTVQTELNIIREGIAHFKTIKLESVPSKGTRLIVAETDDDELKDFKKLIQMNHQEALLGPHSYENRVRIIIYTLLNRRDYISHVALSQSLFVSEATLFNDLKKVEVYLEEYDLSLIRKRNYGLRIQGTEMNKRKCQVNLGNFDFLNQNYGVSNIQEIERILLNVLLEYKYSISETVFKNLLIHIDVTIKRVKQGYFAEDKFELPEEFHQEIKISKAIFDKLGKQLNFTVNEAEINNLAIYIKGKGDIDKDYYISTDIEKFIDSSLDIIKEKFNIDFTQDIDFKIALGMHISPLMIRIKYDIQIQNHLLNYIKQEFTLAFDIAVYMGMLIGERLNAQVEEGELAYLAIYFNQYIYDIKNVMGNKKILIISNMKRSESILLRQRFVTWFPNEIETLEIVNYNELSNIDIEDIDVIFATEQTDIADQCGAILISRFPSEKEYSTIKIAIDGFKNREEILNLFSSNRFYYGKLNTREEVFDKLKKLSMDKVGDVADELMEAVWLRERLGSSFFGNKTAFPHPIRPFPVETFVTVILLEKPIQWDKDSGPVQLIIMVVIEKNNVKAFQLWNYLSKLVHNSFFIDNIIEKPTFDNFRKNVEILLESFI